MPPADCADYLVAILFEIGPTMAGGMGAAPITHGEIMAWKINTCTALSAWEARTLKRLSLEYLSASHAAEARDAQPPWQQPGAKPQVTELQARMRALAVL